MVFNNLYEVRVLGIRRSGNHAIISWLIDNYSGRVVHLNDILFQKGQDPYYALRNRITIKGLPYWRCYQDFSQKTLVSLAKSFLNIPEHFSLQIRDKAVNIEYIRQSPKDFLIYSYEDIDPQNSQLDLFEQNYQKYLGESRKRLEILILRDPFNLFASLLESQMMKKNDEEQHKYVELYKAYAREYLEQSQSGNIEKIYVNYNQWFLSKQYRIQLAEHLGFTSSGEPYEKVAHQGKGSSFDQLKLQNNATQMKVLERWKSYKNDQFYREIFRDQELKDMTETIYGNMADFSL
ncbi:hypothetical protein [Crocosphaera chwakensis]|uniref:Sulfotransferase domain-containing protein n=1 Tax=Crocosphaera chwakensis CCY0110 TaxID=391612 RepID=A3INA1_9CHRO|nr:hypothetical protein [Crocosphaera chwakensis]EAZ92078.1 hypothetical protein CY0110_00430 [Crocosphaera chwakensis CCY0110]